MRWLALVAALIVTGAAAGDLGQWDASEPQIRAWFRSLKMPDNAAMSCCGEADAYWADSYEVLGDQYVAIITDERHVEGRVAREVGTRIVIPPHKVKHDQGNPTGHGIVFLAPWSSEVWCYLPPGGV